MTSDAIRFGHRMGPPNRTHSRMEHRMGTIRRSDRMEIVWHTINLRFGCHRMPYDYESDSEDRRSVGGLSDTYESIVGLGGPSDAIRLLVRFGGSEVCRRSIVGQ